MDAPDISILSDELLSEFQGMERREFGLEASRQFINSELCSRSGCNVDQLSAFSQRLGEAISRYHCNAVTTAEVMWELVGLGKDIWAAHQVGEVEGLGEEEIVCHDALAQNDRAVAVTGNDNLRVIAHALLNSLRSKPSSEWRHGKPARVRMRILVKRIAHKHGCPPVLRSTVVHSVLQQVKVVSARCVV